MSKYNNPIEKPDRVTIPTWEYAALVRTSTIMECVGKLSKGLSEYDARAAIKMLMDEDESGKEGEA